MGVKGLAVVMIVASVALAGCTSSDSPNNQGQGEPPIGPFTELAKAHALNLTAHYMVLLKDCVERVGPFSLDHCREPEAVSNGQWLFHTTMAGDTISRSRTGTSWEQLPLPPLPPGAGPVLEDGLLSIDPEGRLWWSALSRPSMNVVIARSDDAGETWPLVRTLSLGGQETIPSGSDRQWLAFAPDGTALFLCTCPLLSAPMVAVSHDDGESWLSEQATEWISHRNPIGRPEFISNDTYLVPFITGAPFEVGTATGQASRVAVGFGGPGGRSVTAITQEGQDIDTGSWPDLIVDHQGRAWITWQQDNHAYLAFTRDGITWSEAFPIPDVTVDNQRHPAIRPYKGGLAVLTYADLGHSLTIIDETGNYGTQKLSLASSSATDYLAFATHGDSIFVPWKQGDDAVAALLTRMPDAHERS